MSTEILVRPVTPLLHLVPITAHDQFVLSEMRFDRDYRAKLTWAIPRSVKQNAFYWAVLTIVAENHPFYVRPEPIHLWLKTRMGYVNKITFHDGTMHTEVESIAFDKMPADEFKTFLDSALMILCTEVLPGIDREDLIEHTEAKNPGLRYRDLWVPIKRVA